MLFEARKKSKSLIVRVSVVVLAFLFCISLMSPAPAKAASGWFYTDNLTTPRYASSNVLLPEGKTLVIGGFAYGAAIGTVEAYDPFLNDWNFYPNLQTVRYAHTATVLLNGKVLVTGGYNADRVSS